MLLHCGDFDISMIFQDESLTVNHASAVHLVDLIADVKYEGKILVLFMGCITIESSGEARFLCRERPQSTFLMDDSMDAIH